MGVTSRLCWFNLGRSQHSSNRSHLTTPLEFIKIKQRPEGTGTDGDQDAGGCNLTRKGQEIPPGQLRTLHPHMKGAPYTLNPNPHILNSIPGQASGFGFRILGFESARCWRVQPPSSRQRSAPRRLTPRNSKPEARNPKACNPKLRG